MPKYVVELEMTLRGRCEVDAESEDAALDKADQRDPDDLHSLEKVEVSYASIIGTVEEVARIERQQRILAEMKMHNG